MRTLILAVLAFIGLTAPAAAVFVGLTDDFEDGTTQGWVVNLLGMGSHPAPPANIADGGPAGAGDNYLQLTAVGGAGAGSRLSAINLAQWTGDYAGGGVTTITMDVINLGSTDLYLRLFLENPGMGPPTDTALTSAGFLAAGSGWTTLSFDISPAALIAASGSLSNLLAGVTALRIIHANAPGFPGEPVIALLGVDNITAIPIPAAIAFFAFGLAALWRRGRRAGQLSA